MKNNKKTESNLCHFLLDYSWLVNYFSLDTK